MFSKTMKQQFSMLVVVVEECNSVMTKGPQKGRSDIFVVVQRSFKFFMKMKK